MFHTELLEPFSRFLPILLILVGALVAFQFVAIMRRRDAARKRAARRRTNIAHGRSWRTFFTRDKVLRITHEGPAKSDLPR